MSALQQQGNMSLTGTGVRAQKFGGHVSSILGFVLGVYACACINCAEGSTAWDFSQIGVKLGITTGTVLKNPTEDICMQTFKFYSSVLLLMFCSKTSHMKITHFSLTPISVLLLFLQNCGTLSLKPSSLQNIWKLFAQPKMKDYFWHTVKTRLDPV